MSTPTISVVMSVHNGARFLHEAIESILEQTFTDFEFIIVNDGSTDETVSILESYAKRDARVKVYSHAKLGLTESLNRGCMMALGEYIARMDADDISVRDRFMWQMEFMDAHSEVGLLGGAFELIDTRGKTLCTAVNPVEDREIRRALLDGSVFLHPSVLMRKTALDMVGRYRKVMHAEDYDLWLRMAEHTQVANLSKVLVQYRVHSDQVSVSKCKEQALWTGAAQIAAQLRRAGKPDPLDSISEITPAVLTGLGLSESAQQTNTARGYLRCVRNLYRSGEYAHALDAIEALHSEELEQAEKWVIADSYLWAGRLYWRENKIARCIISFLRALVTRPLMLGRPLKPLQQCWQAMVQHRTRIVAK